MTITDPLAWVLWSFCLLVAVLCLRPPRTEYGNLRWLSPRLFFGIVFLLLNVLSPLSIMVTGRTYRGLFFGDEINLMLLASILAGGAFLAGWRWSSTRSLTEPGSTPGIAFTARQQVARVLLLSPLVPLVVAGFMRGLPSTEWLTVYNFGRMALVAIGCLLMLAVFKVQHLFWRAVLLTSGGVVMALYVWLILQQSARLFLLLLVVPVVALWLYGFRRIGALVGVIAAALFVWFFVFFGNARFQILYNQNQSLESLVEVAAPRSWQDIYERLYVQGDLDAFENGTLVMHLIPAVADYYYGATFATLFALPIPRAWWPDKPAASVNYLLADSFGFYSDNFAVSLVAEAYANFSWPGVVLVFLLFGLVSERIYAAAVRERENPENWVHLGFYCAYIILVVRGSFHSMTSYYLMIVVWMVVSAWVIQLPRRLGRGPQINLVPSRQRVDRVSR